MNFYLSKWHSIKSYILTLLDVDCLCILVSLSLTQKQKIQT